MLSWLKREFIALAGVAGAALSVLAQISNAWAVTPPLQGLHCW